MPSVDDLLAGHGPAAEPLTYPGVFLPWSGLLVDGWAYRLRAGTGSGLRAATVEMAGERDGPFGEGPLPRGSAPRVSAPRVSAPKMSSPGMSDPGVDDCLDLLGAPRTSARRPVLAVGSNADPRQLLGKVTAAATRTIVPITRAAVHGLRAGHSTHVSVPGYIPFVPVADARARAALSVLWLDDAQIAAVTATEPNYDLVVLDGADYPLTDDLGNRPTAYAAYRGRWGALRLSPAAAPAPALAQREIYRRLGRQDWFRRLVADAAADDGTARDRTPAGDEAILWAGLFRRDATARARVRAELAARGLAADDGLCSRPAGDHGWNR